MKTNSRYLLGIDIGSSSVKVSILDSETGVSSGSAQSPDQKELGMISVQTGWAEQDPELWWDHFLIAFEKAVSQHGITKKDISAIGISYQMHGLVVVDENQKVLRPSIIWCDSRAVEIGDHALRELGTEFCLQNFLNSPGNFTASKLKWVKENEPELYKKIYKIMLPGDYIAMKLSGNISTTVSGLSEGIFWNFKENRVAWELLNHYGISADLLPEYRTSFENHGVVSSGVSKTTGLAEKTPITYKAGDQPNNAFSLNVLNPGEVAATAGTSSVMYSITDTPDYDLKSRVNTFVHVNHSQDKARYGVLLCVNGTGILNSWIKQNLFKNDDSSFVKMNQIASKAPIGAEGLSVLPFGNGAERILENKFFGAEFSGLNLIRHDTSHFLRAAQEGIVFALNYGFDIMKGMGIKPKTVRAGHANMFLSPLFREAFVNITGTELELYNTDGSLGAARGSGMGAGIYSSTEEAFAGLYKIDHLYPDPKLSASYQQAYEQWLDKLSKQMNIL